MNSFSDTLRSLGPGRLGIMLTVAASTIAFFIYLTSRLATPDLALLYADLDAQDSGQIVSRLEQMEVDYKVGRDGSQIYVPSDQVGRMRVAMAEDGLPTGGSVGYEIFDRSEGLGTTKFVQNINHLRALEGELARTIRTISRVKKARVHLVLPERQLFTRDRQTPTASIMITTQGAQRLEKRKVMAIQHIVAAAVPGLKPSMISIVDNMGTLLARGGDESDSAATGSNAEDMRIAYQTRLVRIIEDLLERSIGMGNVRAQVTAEMDFDRITENSEIYDPDGQVVRSTQTIEETSGTSDAQGLPPVTVAGNLPDAILPGAEGAASSSNTERIEETVNYEISKVIKTHVRESGVVRKLSVAVLINGKVGVTAEGEATYEPRSEEELTQLTALVRSAVGYDETRGDTVEIINMRFIDPTAGLSDEDGGSFFDFGGGQLMRVAEVLVLGVVAILVLLLVVRPLIGRVIEGGMEAPRLTDQTGGYQPALAGPQTEQAALGPTQSEAAAEEIDQMIDISKVEGRVRASSVKKIGEIVDKHPEEAVAIIRNWLYAES